MEFVVAGSRRGGRGLLGGRGVPGEVEQHPGEAGSATCQSVVIVCPPLLLRFPSRCPPAPAGAKDGERAGRRGRVALVSPALRPTGFHPAAWHAAPPVTSRERAAGG